MQMFGTRVQLLILRNIILAFPKNKRNTRYLSKTIGMRLRVFKYIVSEEKNACVCVLAETKSRKIRRKRKKKQLRGAKATPLWQLHRARSRPNRIIIENVVIYIYVSVYDIRAVYAEETVGHWKENVKNYYYTRQCLSDYY